MKKLIFILALFLSANLFAQTIQKRLGLDPTTGRTGYVFNDTVYTTPQVAAFYFNGYGNFVSLRDTVRSYFSVAKSPLSYNSSTGQFDFDTTKFHSYAFYNTVFGSGGGGSSSLSGLTAATSTNTINNLAYKQIWNWNSLTNDTAMIFNSTNTGSSGRNQVLFYAGISGANTNSADTTTTVVFSNKHTGSASANITARFLASGGANQNTAASFEGGWAGGNIRIGSLNQAGNIYFIRGDGNQLSAAAATIGWLSATESSIFQIAPSNGGGELRNAASSITFYTNAVERGRFNSSGSFSLGSVNNTASALLTFAANTTSRAAMIFASGGSLMSTAWPGSMEYVSNGFYQTLGGALRYALGGNVANFYTDSSNVGTTETDMYRYWFPSSTLINAGTNVDAYYAGVFTNASATATLKVYLLNASGGYELLGNTGAMTLTGVGSFKITVNLITVSATVIRSIVTITSSNSSVSSYTNYYQNTANSIGNPTMLKMSATSSGGSGDIVGKMGKITITAPAAN